jgi:hypothetical protein
MTAPLTNLGAAVGVTSLVIQLVDECVKGKLSTIQQTGHILFANYYKFEGYGYYVNATGLLEQHRYLQIRLQIEQQRFLNFGTIWEIVIQSFNLTRVFSY